MKFVLASIFANLLSLSFAGGAIFLAYNDMKGWGWCIFGAIICHTTVSFSKNGDEEDS